MTNTLQASLILYFYPERWVDEGNAAGAAQVKTHAAAKVGGLLDQMDAHLALQDGEWFLGAKFGVLDPFGLMLCRWTRLFPRPARSLPHLAPWLDRVLARPAVQRAFKTEGLGEPYV